MALRDWKKVGIRSFERRRDGRWISWNFMRGKELPFVVDTMKEGYLEILGRFKTRRESDAFIDNYLKKH